MMVRSTSKHRQRGWAGLLVILIALLIVGFLAKDAFKQYGLMPGATDARMSTAPADRLRNPGLGGASPDLSAPAMPVTPIDKARGVEDMIKQQADERAQRMP
jgi:hypothetical protein